MFLDWRMDKKDDFEDEVDAEELWESLDEE